MLPVAPGLVAVVACSVVPARRFLSRRIDEGGSPFISQPQPPQNKKYRCASGSTLAGSRGSSIPSAHLVGLRIHFHQRQIVVVHHVALGDGAGVLDRHGAAFEAEPFRHAGGQCGLGDEGETGAGDGRAERAEHGPVVHRLGVGIEALGSPMGAAGIAPPLRMSAGLAPKNAGFQSTMSASLPASSDPTSWACRG